MGKWHKTGCVLCAQNCGLEAWVEDNRMLKIRPDKDNPRSRGYACRKGLNVIYHQYPADRLREPLKRVGERFEPISWDRAMGEIAEKLQELLAQHGPRCLAYMGGSAQGSPGAQRKLPRFLPAWPTAWVCYPTSPTGCAGPPGAIG
jgi:anaerobic selenocysteine-containing dehydrogenase